MLPIFSRVLRDYKPLFGLSVRPSQKALKVFICVFHPFLHYRLHWEVETAYSKVIQKASVCLSVWGSTLYENANARD